MGVFSRFTDIVHSNIVHMLDKAENPEKMVRLIIQEMEDTLVEVKSQAAKIIANKKHLERELKVFEQEKNRWGERAELAVLKKRDDLALLALEEQDKKEKFYKQLKEEQIVINVSLEKYRGDIVELEQKLLDVKNRQKSLILRKQTATSQIRVRGNITRARSDQAVDKFHQFEKAIDRLEGEVESDFVEVSDNLDGCFRELEDGVRIGQRLEELKQKFTENKNGAK